jgi:predicted dehydrogenase
MQERAIHPYQQRRHLCMNEINLVLVGLGGYGEFYTDELFAAAQAHNARLVAGVDPAPERSAHYQALLAAQIPIFPSLEQFYQAGIPADLVVVSVAIHLHAPLTCLALSRGSFVLCEKPLCASIEDIIKMAEAERQAGKFVAVGYQWSYTSAVQALKQDVLNGILGRPKRLKTIALWPRSASYYQRNDWAGKIKTRDGQWVLDSPAHNATAHHLHNMLYLLGEATDSSAWPFELQAECYRANPIENYDALALRCRTESGVELLFYSAHSVPKTIGLRLYYEFENAVVKYQSGEGETFVAHFHDGRTHSYGDPDPEHPNKLWQAIAAVRSGARPLCGILAAAPQVLCILGAHRSSEIAPFPTEMIQVTNLPDGDTLTWAAGLPEAFERGYEQNSLPSELGSFSWTRPGQVVNLSQDIRRIRET